MRLTDAQIRCLLALLSLTRLGGEIASKDVSTVLGVSRPSVHRMLENLGNSRLDGEKALRRGEIDRRRAPVWRRNSRRGATGCCCSSPAASGFPWIRARWRRRCF